MNKKIEKQGHVAAQARIIADTEFEKVLVLKQEYQKLKQEMTAPNNSAENVVLPQPEAVTDEATKAELNELLAEELALQAACVRLALSFATNPTHTDRSRQAKRTSLDDEDDVDLTEKPPDDMEQPGKAPKTVTKPPSSIAKS